MQSQEFIFNIKIILECKLSLRHLSVSTGSSFYPQPIESGYGLLFLRYPSVLQSVWISFPHFSATTGWNSTTQYGDHQYQEEMRILSPCSGQTLQNIVMALDKLSSLHIEQQWFPRHFSATDGLNSTKLYLNHQYQEKMRISSPCSGQILQDRVIALD
jgi:hypothetical protein